MPNWGLTKAQREIGQPPWDLPRQVLAPGKIYTDPVHQDVCLTLLEQWIVDSPPFQRLRRVRQLGTTHLVYPGATHTRFSHSLGALRVAQDLVDAVVTQRDGLHPVDDLFMAWERAGEDVEANVAEATVLARLGALLHDIGHVPFGHSIEDDRQILEEHDKNKTRLDVLWTEIARYTRTCVGRHRHFSGAEKDEIKAGLETLLHDDGRLFVELEPLIVSKAEGVKPIEKLEYPFVADLVGNTICADLLDYLLRNHLYAGLPAGLGRRFLSGFFVVPAGYGIYERRLALNIMRDGHERPDVVSELLKALRYRYELSERALTHQGKLAADVMVSKALEAWSDAVWLERATEHVALVPDHADLLDAGDIFGLRDALEKQLKADEDEKQAGKQLAELEADVRGLIEEVMLDRGDDSLLEWLASLPAIESSDARVGNAVDALHETAANFARRLLDRELFRLGGRASIKSAPAGELYKKYKEPRAREQLERRTAEFAELPDRHSLLIWLPDPKMRMKPAGVLVDNGQTIKPFYEYEGRGRGEEIYRAHESLWAIWVFVDRSLSDDDREIALAFLSRELGVGWERKDRYGTRPGDRLTELAVLDVENADAESPDVARLVGEIPAAATRGAKTYKDLRTTIRREVKKAKKRWKAEGQPEGPGDDAADSSH